MRHFETTSQFYRSKEWATIRAEITSDFVCIPREEWMEIASKNGEPEIA